MTDENKVANEIEQSIPPSAWPMTIILSAAMLLVIGFCSIRGNHEHAFQGGYVGPQACADCHPKQFDSWKETRMANSFDVLGPGIVPERKKSVGLDPEFDYRKEPACLECHVTGYGKVGGFVSIETTPHMAGVTCEACHGAGGMYAGTSMNPEDPNFNIDKAFEAGLIYPPTAEVCKRCHNDRSPFVGQGYSFEYTERVKRGTHQHYKLKYQGNGNSH